MSPCLPNVVVERDYDAMSRTAAQFILECVECKPDSLLCVATGASPTGVYAHMASQACLLRRTRILKLDEWGGIPAADPSTCETYIRRHILKPWGVPEEQFYGFDTDPADPSAECRRVSDLLAREGGIDVCILGMGADGHIGLNYPAPVLPASASPTDPSTLRHAMLQAAERTPTYGMTLGMGDILRARAVVLVVSGKGKAEAVARLLSGEITTDFPASFLWGHPRLLCVVDKDAAPA